MGTYSNGAPSSRNIQLSTSAAQFAIYSPVSVYAEIPAIHTAANDPEKTPAEEDLDVRSAIQLPLWGCAKGYSRGERTHEQHYLVNLR